MRGREHVAVGVASTALLLGMMQSAQGGVDAVAMLPALVAVSVGSLAPDLDHPGSLASLTIPVTLVSYAGMFLLARRYEIAHPGALPFGFSTVGPEVLLAAWVSLAVGITLLLLSFIFGSMFGHRGAVHSIAFGLGATALVLLGLALFKAPLWWAVPFAWGWFAHLMTDAMTPAGLPNILWPMGD